MKICDTSVQQFMALGEQYEQQRLDAYLEQEDEGGGEDQEEELDDREEDEPDCNNDGFDGYDKICNGK